MYKKANAVNIATDIVILSYVLSLRSVKNVLSAHVLLIVLIIKIVLRPELKITEL